LEIKKENEQFGPGHRDIRSPEPQNKPGQRKKRVQRLPQVLILMLRVKGSGKTKTTLIPQGMTKEK
jgi:hypothetical protein